jgi:L-ascorbate metabolism protein UlaG (beta-lactamase superfamily)
MYWFRFTTVIPKSEWESITHIFITHGDPDHYWHADRVARASNAQVICNKTMVREVNGKALMLGPRAKGVRFTTEFNHLNLLAVDETIELDGMTITGLKATHGELVLKVGPFSKTVKTGPNERIGWGAIGFEIILNDKKIVNLGDTLLHEKEWESIKQPDVLMIPIGGKVAHNTMDEEEAQEVKIIQPKLVIPCHYNCAGLFSKSLNPADDLLFKKEVEQAGSRCIILGTGDSLEI